MASEIPLSSEDTSGRWNEWQTQLNEIGGANPLRNFEPNSWAQIDLTKAHPGGLAQFVSTSGVRLSNLVRDPLALSRAIAAANRIHAKSRELSLTAGVDSTYLVGGLASLQGSGFDLSLPILMWPIAIHDTGGDFQITKVGNPLVNPELVLAFTDCFGVRIDEQKLLNLLTAGSDLVPMSVLEYLSNLGAETTTLELKRVLTLANFVPEITSVRTVGSSASSAVIDSLLTGKSQELSQPDQPVIRCADLDENQLSLISRALRSESFAVEVLPGCGYTQTVAAMIANLAYYGKKTLLIANRMQTVDEISNRLTSLGLSGLLARNHSSWLDVVAAISRNEKTTDSPAVADHLERVTSELDDYQQTLSNKSSLLRVSLLDAFTNLASLASMPHPPVAVARIPAQHLVPRDEYRDFEDLLAEAQKYGVFEHGPKQSAWYGCRFDSEQQIADTLVVAKRLRAETFPNLSMKLTEFITTCEFLPADSVSQWGVYLRLFTGLRETLDKLKPEVFDRPLDDLIEATSARKTKTAMTGKTRRRLKKLAKEFVRPGMVVSDINEALAAAKTQKELWSRYTTNLKPPSVPNGINDALVSYQALVNDLKLVQSHMHPGDNLEEISLGSLGKKLDSLCEATEPLQNYFAKRSIIEKLSAAGLEQVVDDFAHRNVKAEHLVAEFDQVWWQSALENLISESPQFLDFDFEKLYELEVKFKALDAAAVEAAAGTVAVALAESWEAAKKAHPGQVEIFRTILRSGKATLPELLANARDLVLAVSPVLAMPALQVPKLLPIDLDFDVVILLDAAGTTIGENLAALSRTQQLVAFGDEVIATANGFETEPAPKEVLVSQKSAFREVSNCFPVHSLRVNYRADGQILGPFVNREFYQNRIQFEPAAAEYFGHSRVKLNLVTDGSRAVSSAEGANESLDAEVIKTVELVFNHAVWHPEDSLLVVSASDLHVQRVRASIATGLMSRPDLQSWFESHGSERFEVATLTKLRHRIADRVIFSIGFGKSQHGAVLSNFGDLSGPDGRRGLANMLVSARKELHIVSCFSPEDLAKENFNNSTTYLRDLLAATIKPEVENFSVEPNPMLEDLALRLRKLGVTVKFGFGQQLNMIASFGNKAMVLVPDWGLHGHSASERYRLRPRLIENLGWTYKRITSFELFSDPLTLAQRIARELGLSVKHAGQQSFEPDWSAETSVVDLRDPNASNDSRLNSERPPHWG